MSALFRPRAAGRTARLAALAGVIVWYLASATTIDLIRGALHLAGRAFPALNDATNILQSGKIAPGPLAFAEALSVVAVLLVTLLLVMHARRRNDGPLSGALLDATNMRRPVSRWAGMAPGALCGFASIMVVFGAEAACGGYHVVLAPGSVAMHLASLALFALGFLLVGVNEELGTRGYIQNALSDAVGFMPAALITSLWFGLEHVLGRDPLIGAVQVVEFALFSCGVLWLTGSLRFMIGFHAAWDWGQTAFFGTNDSGYPALGSLFRSTATGSELVSGGAVGPEGGVPAMIFWTVLLVVPYALAARRAHGTKSITI